jgi:hypothetical protein
VHAYEYIVAVAEISVDESNMVSPGDDVAVTMSGEVAVAGG